MVCVTELLTHLKSPETEERICTWSKPDCPKTRDIWSSLKDDMVDLIVKRIQQEVKDWENQTHTFQGVHSELVAFFSKKHEVIWNQSYRIDMQMFGAKAAPQMPETEEEFELSAGGKVAIGLTFPVWIPLAIALAVIAVPAFIGWVVFEVMGGDMIHANIEKEMSKMSKDILKKFSSSTNIHKELKPVKLQLQVVMGEISV